MVPVRDVPVLFACAVYDTSPLAVPLAVFTVIQPSVVVAVHVQEACVVTVNVPLPPAAAMAPDGGLSV